MRSKTGTYFRLNVMSYRFMRVIVFFDLPIETSEERREYRKFRKALLRNGFIMAQESVYSKIALNNTAAEAIKETVRKHKPQKGLIEMLVVTEKQFENIEFVLGEGQTDVIDSADRLVIL